MDIDYGYGLVELNNTTYFVQIYLDYSTQTIDVYSIFSLESNLQESSSELLNLHNNENYYIISQQFLDQKKCIVYLIDKKSLSSSNSTSNSSTNKMIPSIKLDLNITADRLDFFTVNSNGLYYFDTHRSPHFHKFPTDLKTLWRVDLETIKVTPQNLESSPDIPTYNQMNGYVS